MSTIHRVGVIGAGTMGNGIAQACAVAGLHVVMVDVTEAAVLRGMSAVTASLDRLHKKDKITVADKDADARAHQGHAPTTPTSGAATSSSRPRPRTRS